MAATPFCSKRPTEQQLAQRIQPLHTTNKTNHPGDRVMTFRNLTLCAMLAGTLATAPAHSDDFFGMHEDPFAVDIEQLADGVYVATRPFSWRLPVQANVTIVINDEDVVLVDGAGLPAHAEHIIRAIRELTDKPVSTILTTHWHGDHNLGYSVFRREYPDVRIVAHENTRHSMANGVMNYALGATEEGIQPGNC